MYVGMYTHICTPSGYLVQRFKKADLVNTQKTETQALGSLREEEHVCCFTLFLHAPRPSPMCFGFEV